MNDRLAGRALWLAAAALCVAGCAGAAQAGRGPGRLMTATPLPQIPASHDNAATPEPTASARPTASLVRAPQAQTSEVRVLFTGDINPGRCPAQIALAADDYTLPYRAVAAELQVADLVVGSLDGVLSDLSPPIACVPEGEYNLIGPTRTVEGLAYAGFDLVTLATNHALDCGHLGFVCDGLTLSDTLAAFRAVDIATVGAGLNRAEARQAVVLSRNGLRLAFLGASAVGEFAWAGADTPGIAPLSTEHLHHLLSDIRAARASADIVVVLLHWGVEYESTPSIDQRRWAERMLDAGATVIVGTHPHVTQPIEPLGAGLVAYSLGNFVFDQDPQATRAGNVLEATFTASGLGAWRVLPIEIVDLHRPEWR